MTPAPQLTPAPFVTIELAASLTGLTQKAIRRKIEDGKWLIGEPALPRPLMPLEVP